MIRVLQAMAGAAHGGAEAFFERLVPALQRAGIEQRALIRTNPKRSALLRAGGVEVVEAPFGGALDIATRMAFRRQVKEFAPDVVMTWMNRASRFCPRGRPAMVGRLGGYYDLKYYRGCDHLVGNTRDIVDYIVARGWPAERAHYLPNFAAEARARPVPRDTFGTPAGPPLILALGRLHENKGFDVLLRALARLPEAHLWIAGEGPLRADLERLARTLCIEARVRLLGWRDDAPALFAAADLFVCPSRHEPLGNVVIEAWSQARPVVAAAAQGPAALIRDGETGVLVPIDDTEALAGAVRRLLAAPDLAARLAAAGRAAYEAEYTEAAVVAAYRAFFEKVAA